MTKIFLIFGLFSVLFSKCDHIKDSKNISFESLKNTDRQNFRDFYGIAWRGNVHDNLKYAKQMSYSYVFYQPGMEKDSLAIDFKFYIETPQYSVYPVSRYIDINKTHSEKEKILYETYFAKKNNKNFPFNMATGWYKTSTCFSVEPDYQQQEVIDTFINRIISYAKSLERKENNFLFGGFAWDVPQLPGDFWDTIAEPNGKQITLSYWTGGDFAYEPKGVLFDYTTYSDGHAAFYKYLFKQTRKIYPGARFIIEPITLWEAWFEQIKDRADAKELMPDMANQELQGTEFVSDSRIFKTGLITKAYVGSTTPNRFGEKENREYAAAAAINGAWFGWFGRFGGTGDMPDFRNIYEVPPRLQLVRRVANWDNLNAVPLSQRSWNGKVYRSPLSYISPDVIWSTQPNTGKIFAVWLSPKGLLQLPDKSKLNSVFRTDSFFIETVNGMADFQITDKGLKLINQAGLTKGYIFNLK